MGRTAHMPWTSIARALGLGSGGGVRTAFGRLLEILGLAAMGGGPGARASVGFTIAIIGLAAKLSKADGVSVPIEAETFFALYPVPPGERDNVRRLFDLARQDTLGFEHYADQIARRFHSEPQLRSDVLDVLFHIAAADGILHAAEDAFLREVARRFGLNEEEYLLTRARFVADADDPYVILGISRDASDSAVKSHYRRLAKETHPDLLVARGVPPELTAHAERKLARITAAYERISRERGL